MTLAKMSKAELLKRIRARKNGAPASANAFEHERLLHELQVHQIELETQNRELREAQLLLEKSRDLYADLYDFAPVGFVTFDDKGVIREINLTAASLLGVERTRLVGAPFQQHVAREDLARFREHLATRSTPDARATTELRLTNKSGDFIPVEMHSVLVYAPEKKKFLRRTSLIDITVRQRAEQELRDNEARLRAVLETAADGIITFDERGIIESFNRAAEKLFGYRASEAIGQNINLLMPLPHRAGQDPSLSTYRDTGERKIIGNGREGDGRRKNGTFFPLELSVSEVRLAGRRIFTGFVHDMSRRKQAEDSLREERDFVSAILQTAGALIIVLDEAGRIVRFNQACQQLTGYAAEEIEGKIIWKVLLPPEEVVSLQAVFEQLRDRHLPSRHENCWRTKAGQRRVISWSNTVLMKPDGKVRSIISTGLDITERKRNELRRHLHYETARLLAASGSLSETVAKLLKNLGEAFQWDVGEFWEVMDMPKTLRVVHIWHAPGKNLAAFAKDSLKRSISMFDGLPGQVLASGKPEWIPEITQLPHFDRKRPAAQAGLRSALAFPIRLDDRVLGVVAFLTHRPTEPDEDLLQWFASLGSQIGQFMERKKAEEALREAHEFSKQVIGGTQAGIVVCDREGRFVVWNPFMEQISGYRSGDLLGRRVVDVFPFLREEHFGKMFQRALAGEVFKGPDIPFHLPEKGKQGWTAARFAPLRDARQEIVGVIVAIRDITERRRLESELLEISDREQQRIGHDLHDGLGQQLTALELMCHSLQEDLAVRHPRLEKQSAKMGEFLRQAVAQTRALSRGLSPVNLEAAGLMEALRELARATNAAGKVNCRFHCPAPVLMADSAVAGHLYRIAQEAVNNALKHGRPDTIEIELSYRDEAVRLRIANDGKDFPNSRKPGAGMGLEVMKHRVNIIGGSLTIDSHPGQGVTVNCVLSLKKS